MGVSLDPFKSADTSEESPSPVKRVLGPQEPQTGWSDLDRGSRRFLAKSSVTLFAVMILVAYLLPLGFMAVTALKSEDQIANQQVLPRSPVTVELDGEDYELLAVPIDGQLRSLALVKPGRASSIFIDPTQPDVEIAWEGKWRALDAQTQFDPNFDNFGEAWDALDFLLVLRNTGIIAGLGMAGTVISSTLVAYGLSRFRMPFKGLILSSLIATIILPGFVTLVPTYAVFLKLGWVGTWAPLIIPHFFGNAYNIFLLRQFFLSIPRDLDEAASIDGASPLMTLITVILPQAIGAFLAVSLFHFFFAWNDFLGPLIYLAGERSKIPISVALYDFLGLYDTAIPLVQAGAMLSMAVPILVFIFLQKIFLGGIDLSGSVK